MNNYWIAGASQISPSGSLNAVGDITTSIENSVSTTRNITTSGGTINGKFLSVTNTSTFLGNKYAPNIYTKTEVDTALSEKN